MSRLILAPGNVTYHHTISEYENCTVHLMVGEAHGYAAAETRVVEVEGPPESCATDTGLRGELELAVYDKLVEAMRFDPSIGMRDEGDISVSG